MLTRASRFVGSSLLTMVLLGCGGGGGGGGGGQTTFKGAASGNGSVTLVEMVVNTTSFSPPAPLLPTSSSLVAAVPASVTLRTTGGTTITTLTGTWDEGNNTLDVAGSGITMDGGYNVPTNQIGGQIDYGTGAIDDWNGLKGSAGTIYCGTWTLFGTSRPFAMVIRGVFARGYADEFGTEVNGDVSGNSVSFTAGGSPGTATFGASMSGSLGGVNFTGTACG